MDEAQDKKELTSDSESSSQHTDSESSYSDSESVDSEDVSLKDDSPDVVPEEIKVVPCEISFLRRKGFPFCCWYITSLAKDESISLDSLIETIQSCISKLFVIDEINLQIIRGDHEFDRLRFIIPNLIVDATSALDLRNLILSDLGFKEDVHFIPKTPYLYDVFPMILIPRQYDMGTGKWQPFQQYKDLLNPERKTAEIEKDLAILSQYNPSDPPKLTEFTDEYKEFLNIRDDNPLLPEDVDELMEGSDLANLCRRDPTSILFTEKITEEIKKSLGKAVVKCQNWFHKFHPDAKLRGIKNFKDNDDVFHFDFTKSNKKCRLCKVIHHSNRQYITYSKKSNTAYYHCYDTNARGQQLKIKFA